MVARMVKAIPARRCLNLGTANDIFGLFTHDRRRPGRPQETVSFFRPVAGAAGGAHRLGRLAGAVTRRALADSAQTLLGWLVVGLVAAIAVTALVMGLERLQDCEGG